MSTETITAVETPATPAVDTTMPPQDRSEGNDTVRISQGTEAKKSAFGDLLDKAKATRESSGKPEGETRDKFEATFDKPKEKADDKKDPIAAKNEEAAKEKKKEDAKEEKPELEGKFAKLNDLLAKKGKPAVEEKETDKKAEKTDDVSLDEIEQELKNPHKSERAQKRFLALHKRWKDEENVHATTKKELAEKKTAMAELEKKIAAAGEVKGLSPEEKAKYEALEDEVKQWRRQYATEQSDDYKKLEKAYEDTENEIANLLLRRGVKFKNQTAEQTIEFIKREGGFAEFQRKYPDIARQIREDLLDVADNDEIQAAISNQRLFKNGKDRLVQSEKSKAKEYFAGLEAQEKAKAEAAAKAPKPEDVQAKRKQTFDAWRGEVVNHAKLPFFRDEDVPADASAEAKAKLTLKNERAAALRAKLEQSLNSQSDDEIADLALAATLAHQIRFERDDALEEVAALKEEIKRLKSAGKTVVKSTQPPASSKPVEPPKSFAEAIRRVEAAKE